MERSEIDHGPVQWETGDRPSEVWLADSSEIMWHVEETVTLPHKFALAIQRNNMT